MFCKYFLQVCSFHSLHSVSHKVFNFNNLPIYFLPWIVPLMLYLKTHHQIQGHLDFILFSIRSFIILHFTFRFMTKFRLILVKDVWSLSMFFFLFCIWTHNFYRTICWKDYPFSIELPLVKDQLTIYEWIYFWALFSATVLCVYSLPDTTLSWSL